MIRLWDTWGLERGTTWPLEHFQSLAEGKIPPGTEMFTHSDSSVHLSLSATFDGPRFHTVLFFVALDGFCASPGPSSSAFEVDPLVASILPYVHIATSLSMFSLFFPTQLDLVFVLILLFPLIFSV